MRYLRIMIKGVLAIICLIFFLIVAFNNTQKVTFNWFLNDKPIDIQLIVLLFTFFAAGMLCGIMGIFLHSRETNSTLRKMKKEEKRLIQELAKKEQQITTMTQSTTEQTH